MAAAHVVEVRMEDDRPSDAVDGHDRPFVAILAAIIVLPTVSAAISFVIVRSVYF
ncbi:hypothetical protein [Gordonia sp. 'Campus']|uniref:hypothetical protein n=1 Tax=Gordonia sp. 'Campus' TaxID=2915824 RepID=UPI001EE3AC93|nr:hypothetical protein [Gordonia sp. 'Campus']